jgi:hypothetical protein
MYCQVKDELVSQLMALNNKLNLLSPDLYMGTMSFFFVVTCAAVSFLTFIRYI